MYEGKNDYDFLPNGSYHWDEMKYTHKLHNMARVLSEMGTDRLPGIGCAVIGLSEVENDHGYDREFCQRGSALALTGYFCHHGRQYRHHRYSLDYGAGRQF